MCCGVCFPMLCPAAGRREAEFAAEKCCVGPSAIVLLVLYGQLDFARRLQRGERMGTLWWGRLGEKGTTKSCCGGAAGTPCCRSLPCRQRNACFDSCHGNKFILRPVQRLAATWQGGQELVQPAASPEGPREAGGMGIGFVPARCSASCKIQADGFLPQKERPAARQSFWGHELGSTGVQS